MTIESTYAISGPGSQRFTSFDLALEEYIGSIPNGKKKLKFIDLCRDSGTGVSPSAINELIRREEAKHALSGPVKRHFRRITSALEDYSEVIGQFVSAQPLPLAIIWGALKIGVESAARCRTTFDVMKDELNALADQIQRITDYDDLYGDSESMQRFFFRSYTNMIRFWHRVHKECGRSRIGTVGHSLTSASSRKLNAIVSDMRNDADHISREASIQQAKLDRQEHADAQIEREAAVEERVLQSEWRHKQNSHNYLELCGMIRNFLGGPAHAIRTNSQRHESNVQHHHLGTCDWLSEDAGYAAWLDLSSCSYPVLCLSGPPGYGKSTLTSFAIQDTERRAAVAYYFCQFSQPCDSVHELFLLLALQLFNVYFARKLPVDGDLCHQVLSSTKPQHVQELIRELVMNLTPTYFFIDGLDEAVSLHGQHVISVLQFLTDLCDKFGGRVRLWCSKRRQTRPVECYDVALRSRPHVTLEMADHTEADVVRYLRSKFAVLEARLEADADNGLTEAERNRMFIAENCLISRAQGNFLWARLMTQDFEGEDRISDVSDLVRRVHADPPASIEDLYKSVFGRIKNEDRKIASKVIALVAYARRHLRIEEVREAALLLLTRGKKNGNDGGLGKMSLTTFLSKFTALIEVDAPASGPVSATATCRLLHSSVLEFLIIKPEIFGEERALHVTPYSIADACLLYLTRPIYSKLLQTNTLPDGSHVWVDASGHSMDEHHLAQYAAKNWARHLEDVQPGAALQTRVASFVGSANFQTCIQLQTLWVQGKFDVYCVDGRRCLLRVLPAWFIRPSPKAAVSKQWADYRSLLRDWQRLLSCDGCHDSDPDCPLLEYRGEVDRIWWGALGPGNTFSTLHSQYTSFLLAEGAGGAAFGRTERYEALFVGDGRVTILWLSSWDRDAHMLAFFCEHWISNKPASPPRLESKQCIRTEESSCNWRMYAKASTEGSTRLVAHPTMVDDEGRVVRIGSQIFVLDEDGEYAPLTLNTASVGDGVPCYFEECAARGSVIVLASRAYTAAQKQQDVFRDVEGFGKDFKRQEKAAMVADDDPDGDQDDVLDLESSEEESYDSTSDFARSSNTDTSNDEYESWSEASTEDDRDIKSDEEDGVCAESSSSSDYSAADISDSPEESSSEDDAASDSSENPPPLPATAFLAFAEQDSDEEDDFWGIEVGARLDAIHEGRAATPKRMLPGPDTTPGIDDSSQMILTVLDTSARDAPQVMFSLRRPLVFMLYASPPAIHPSRPLVVWPLGAGDVLFADIVAKSYFVRKLRLSTTRTRHISVKPHFSPCGGYLHVASLEAQLDEPEAIHQKRRKSESESKAGTDVPRPALRLSLLLATYRLSSRKLSRAPPALMHRAKLVLGSRATLAVSRLPFTFAWTAHDLYLTESGANLIVHRIALFRPVEPADAVRVPRLPVLLPDTAPAREVHFVPSDAGHNTLVIGAETRARAVALESELAAADSNGGDSVNAEAAGAYLAPPIGCVLHEEADLGGWVRAEHVAVRAPRGGTLERRREKFDPTDDCDVEPYLQFY